MMMFETLQLKRQRRRIDKPFPFDLLRHFPSFDLKLT
jgi:hypothetical protein